MGATRWGASSAPDTLSAHAAASAALGRRLRDLRSARGFSLQEFAQLAGLTAPMMSALERGDEDAPLVALVAAAEALDLPLSAVVADAPVAPASAAPISPPAAPRGYVPLEMPELWEPPHEKFNEPAWRTEPFAVVAPAAPVAVAAVPVSAPQPVFVAQPVSAPQPVAAPAPAASRGPVPRTFADLRAGVLAGREFATLPAFAVAAVVEAGHALAVVAAIFRVPTWRLEAWVRDGVATPPPPKAPFRRPA